MLPLSSCQNMEFVMALFLSLSVLVSFILLEESILERIRKEKHLYLKTKQLKENRMNLQENVESIRRNKVGHKTVILK